MKISVGGQMVEPEIVTDPKTKAIRLKIEGFDNLQPQVETEIACKLALVYRQESERQRERGDQNSENYGAACTTISILDQKLLIARVVIESLVVLEEVASCGDAPNVEDLGEAVASLLNSGILKP